ncbi:MAG: type II secretion system protein GspG [SAR324 cluster bacterium]|nr:type II secretion system protein GspG [SAR324 cluster bacterium]
MKPTIFEKKHKRTGFSMVEILTVLGIMGLLSAALVPLAGKNIEEAQNARAQGELQGLNSSLTSFYQDTGWYPYIPGAVSYQNTGNVIMELRTIDGTQKTGTTFQNIQFHLIENESTRYRNWRGPYMSNTMVDPWGNTYKVLTKAFCPNVAASRVVWAFSAGRDGTYATAITHTAVQADDIGVIVYRNLDGGCK